MLKPRNFVPNLLINYMKKSAIITLAIAATTLRLLGQCPVANTEYNLTLTTDNFGSETSWLWLDVNTGDTLAYVPPNTYGGGITFDIPLCIPTGHCGRFTIFDAAGEGICCGNGQGSYTISLNGQALASGGQFGASDTEYVGCPQGLSCSDPIVATTNVTYTTFADNTWYAFTVPDTAIYTFTTCALGNTCDTKIWLYDRCVGLNWTEDNQGTLGFNDDGCGNLAELNAILTPNVTYYVRIGDNMDDCTTDSIHWRVARLGPVIGCMDPLSCNYQPLATVVGACYYQGDPNCSGPDLVLDEQRLRASLEYDVQLSNDACGLNEGCYTGLGMRQIVKFSTKIANTGLQDYYVGNPNTQPSQFTFDLCHQHNHYDGYAKYLLYDQMGNPIPAGFKNGFCVIDLGCAVGRGKYTCGNMGISAGCYDEYWSGLQCQWVDVTDVPDGPYTLVLGVNWDNAPDALGRREANFDNNWAQACIEITTAPNGSRNMTQSANCTTFVDCAGVRYGSAIPDCNGVCNGTTLRGDLNNNGIQEMMDSRVYFDEALTQSLTPSPCNDLNADNEIDLYDAALLANCILYGASHVHTPGQIVGQHDHCRFPWGVMSPRDTVSLRIDQINTTSQYVDIAIKNPNSKVVGYQFKMRGLNILRVENLMPAAMFPVTPSAAASTKTVMGMSFQDSTIHLSGTFNPLVRVYYTHFTDSVVCIEEIKSIVNNNYHEVNTVIAGGCLNVSPNTSVGETAALPHLTIAPNPTNGLTRFSFNNPLGRSHRLDIIDPLGNTVVSHPHFTSEEVWVDVRNLPAGIYFYKFGNEIGPISGKLIVN